MSLEEKGVSYKDIVRWECQDCDAVGPRVTEENHLEILAKLNSYRGGEPITMATRPEDRTNAEWVCALHATIKHRKHENVQIKVQRNVQLSAAIIEKILAEKLPDLQNTQEC